jgi:dTDP-4-amino-4,6-dideoxygalactose transaminase
MVPFLDLKIQQDLTNAEIRSRFDDIIKNTNFILGAHVEEFEDRFKELQEAKYCIGVSSGTAALQIALMAAGIRQNDKVIIPVNTFIATAEAVSMAGAIPVFVDCDQYYNLDIAAATQAVEKDPSIRAIIPVHLYGQPANMGRICLLADKYKLTIIEDCCQAHLAAFKGSRVGNAGAFGAYSFYPGKNLGAYGDAGALTTNDETLYETARMLRHHGEIERYHHQIIGHNFRMDAFQGAVLATKAKYIQEWTEKRRYLAALYTELLIDVDEIRTPEELDCTYCVYHLYVIRTERRDELKTHLQQRGIATAIHYPVPIHLQPAYGFLGHSSGDFPCAEHAAATILSLPMYPELTEEQIRCVVENIKRFFAGNETARTAV